KPPIATWQTCATLKSLRVLRLQTSGAPNLTDAGLVHFKKMRGLRSLSLEQNSAVTDEGLIHLKGLSDLVTLKLRGTNVTAQGVSDLKTALPKTQIWFVEKKD